jgi:poly(A) polymerase
MLFEDDAELRFAALLPNDRAVVAAAAQRLRLSNALRDRLLAACSDDLRLTSFMSPREMRRAIYRLGPKAFKDRVKLAWAASDRTATYVQWRMLYTYADAWTPPPFPLDGAEIMAAGVPEGPLIGRVRREVEAWWIDLDFTDDKLAVLERLKAVAQGLAY